MASYVREDSGEVFSAYDLMLYYEENLQAFKDLGTFIDTLRANLAKA